MTVEGDSFNAIPHQEKQEGTLIHGIHSLMILKSCACLCSIAVSLGYVRKEANGVPNILTNKTGKIRDNIYCGVGYFL